jgi:hypothetical protein
MPKGDPVNCPKCGKPGLLAMVAEFQDIFLFELEPSIVYLIDEERVTRGAVQHQCLPNTHEGGKLLQFPVQIRQDPGRTMLEPLDPI